MVKERFNKTFGKMSLNTKLREDGKPLQKVIENRRWSRIR